METEKITDNVMLIWEDECYLFTDVKKLEYIEIEAGSDYDGGYEIDVNTKREKLDINTTDYNELKLLEALGKITKSEANKRY